MSDETTKALPEPDFELTPLHFRVLYEISKPWRLRNYDDMDVLGVIVVAGDLARVGWTQLNEVMSEINITNDGLVALTRWPANKR